MGKRLFTLALVVFCCGFVAAQNNITKTAAMNYTSGPPTYVPSRVSGSEYAIDTTNGRFYQLHRTSPSLGTWKLLGQGIDTIGTNVKPTYAPTRNMSWFVVNNLDSLYRYSGTGVLWDCINCGVGTTNLTFTGAASPYTLNSNTGTDVTFTQGAGITLTRLLNDLAIAAIDASTTNEIQTYAHTGTTSYTNTLSLGGGAFTLNAAGILAISHTAGAVTLTATEVDGSISNELQTLSNASTATTHTATLSNAGGSIQLAEGAGITLTTTGTALDGVVTIASSLTNFYQTWRDDGLAKTQRDAANFVSSVRIDMILTDDAVNGETEVTADLVLNSVADGYLSVRGAASVMGRSAATGGNVADIVSASDGQVLRRSGATLGWGQVATLGITDDAVTYAKIQNAVANNVLLGNNNGAGTDYEELTVANVYTLLGMSGQNLRFAIWTGANTLTHNAAYTFDAGNGRMTITPTAVGLGAGLAGLNISTAALVGSMEFLQMRGSISGNLLAGQFNTNNSNVSAHSFYTISSGGTAAGDAFIQFQIAGVGGSTSSLGADNAAAGDPIRLTPNVTTPGGTANVGMTWTLDALTKVGINKDDPNHPLDVKGRARATQFTGHANDWVVGNFVAGTALNGGGSITSATGTGNDVTVEFSTGTTPAANGNVFVVTFPLAFNFSSYITWSAYNKATVDEFLKFYQVLGSSTGFTWATSGTLTAGTAYRVTFHIGGSDNN